jgi:hypothetical protein
MTRDTRIPLAITLLAAFVLAACEIATPGPQPSMIAIAAPVHEMLVGDSVQLSSVVRASGSAG